MISISDFVKAYRSLERPNFASDLKLELTYDKFDPKICEAIKLLRSSDTGRFEEILIDGDEIELDASIPEDWTKLEFSFKLQSSGDVHIYQNVSQLINKAKIINRGILPEIFFVIDENYFSSEKNCSNKKIDSLRNLCQLILCLADLAHYHDQKSNSESYKLVFIKEESIQSTKTIIIEPHITEALLTFEIEPATIQGLMEKNIDKNPQLLKERSIFRTSVTEFLDGTVDTKEKFYLLVQAWGNFISLFQNNLDTYLSGFSFHKAKQEVANAELTIAEQLSKIVSDISGKILSIPISLAATIAVVKADTCFESSVVVLGVLMASGILAETLSAQKLQFERIKHSRSIIFSSHEKKSAQYPKDLQVFLSSAISGLDKNERKLKNSLRSLRLLCWLPAITAATTHAYLYKAELVLSWTSIIACFIKIQDKLMQMLSSIHLPC